MNEERARRVSREMFVAAFGPLGEAENWLIERITAVLEERIVRAGEAVYAEGDPPSWIHFMHDGRVRTSRKDGPAWTLQGRWILGIFEGILDVPRVTTAIAETDLQLLRTPTSSWLEMIEDSFDLTRGSILVATRSATELELCLAAPYAPAPIVPRIRRASTLIEKLTFMLDVPMLRGAGVQALADLASGTQEETFDAGQVVLERGVERDRLVFVVDGEVRADRASPEIVRTYGYAQLVCGAASIGPWSAPWRAVATVPTRTLSVPFEAGFDAIEEHFDLARSVLAAVATHRQLVLEQLAREVNDLVLT
jgi:CRP-like cAMP-binding protein